MENESIKWLRARAGEIETEIVRLKSRLVPLEIERSQIEMAIRAMTGELIQSRGVQSTEKAIAHHRRMQNPDIQSLTLKEMVIKALMEHFRKGATARQLLTHFSRVWGREVERTSLSPQLSRLKAEGRVVLMGKVWLLAHEGKVLD